MAADAAGMNTAQDEITAARAFRTAFRAVAGAAATATDFIIDQFHKPDVTANAAATAYNAG